MKEFPEPSRIIVRLGGPLIEPLGNEREGCVPNVICTGGAMIIPAGHVIIPSAMSDYAATVATVKLDELVEAMA